ncbi:MAG: tRNA (adenosine(37)-N6)-threonylcarbamoyltransferase complex dimerization subunit type 1 TsaB [Chloroflexota bacterium]
MILAIDTAGEQASVALVDGEAVQAEHSWLAHRNHMRQLDDVLRDMLARVAIVPAGIHAIAVAHGPGSFNGLRVGIAAAQGLAFGLQVPLVGISTLDVIAFQASLYPGRVWALQPAGRDEIFSAAYQGGPSWRRISEYRRTAASELATEYTSDVLLAGSGTVVLAEHLGGFPTVYAPGPLFAVRRAGYLAELGRRYFDDNGTDQADSLQPLYLRRSAAEENRTSDTRE